MESSVCVCVCVCAPLMRRQNITLIMLDVKSAQRAQRQISCFCIRTLRPLRILQFIWILFLPALGTDQRWNRQVGS